MKRPALVLVPALFLLGACATTGGKSVDDVHIARQVETGMLQTVPQDQRGAVENRTQELLAARDEHANAIRAAQRAEDERALAVKEEDIAEARLERADAAIKVAEKGTRSELEAAQRERSEVEAIVAAAKRRIELRERQVERSRARQELARERHEAAMARLELAKAEAVAALDEPPAKPVDVEAFRRQVREAEEDVGLAEVRWQATKREVEATRSLYRESIQATPASYQKEWTDWDEQAAEREENLVLENDPDTQKAADTQKTSDDKDADDKDGDGKKDG